MISPDFSLPKPLFSSFPQWRSLKTLIPISSPQIPKLPPIQSISLNNPKLAPIQAISQNPSFSISPNNNVPQYRRSVIVSAGRSNKKPGQSSGGRIEGNAEVRREAKFNARRKSKKLAENLFYRLKNPHKNQADNFSEEELQMVGLGYDRMVRFMDQDDPNIRHPDDWYKYGDYGPYSWRGIVVGDPIRGRFSDETVTLIGEVRDHEEWEEIEKFDMAADYGKRLETMDKTVGFKYFWVFVRHPKWRVTDLPWQQWTLVCEVAVEAGDKQRLDKWTLMGRLGNKARALITQCAAWMRPDIIYVKRPVYQCRFEPQSGFFRTLGPLLDPMTEKDYEFELINEDGRVEICTYFGGLCKIVKVNPKAYVDDVVKAYEKLNGENKSRCLEFLLSNHPVDILHPYTKEWKAKLEEMELGCDAPDEDDDTYNVGGTSDNGETQITDWIEDDGDEDGDDNVVFDSEEGEEDDLGIGEESVSVQENEKYWENEFKKALTNSEAMENLVKQSVEASTEMYKRQLRTMDKQRRGEVDQLRAIDEENILEDGSEDTGENIRPKSYKDEWQYVGQGPTRRRIKKSKIPPELFLKAAVRPFTYRNLVKEIVLLRHAIIDGDVSLNG
ncbi:hypothetical protein GIB67_008245 [Kingdonia uniflora]|uniref:Uncharacterized protein n=1 Tax=Kingdonia uniflora TaxID=39325 RepID=A0A7J7N4R4_9MAGN|nr:hypothetical protein GIB67_008245 [Kingdonia uniflora]